MGRKWHAWGGNVEAGMAKTYRAREMNYKVRKEGRSQTMVCRFYCKYIVMPLTFLNWSKTYIVRNTESLQVDDNTHTYHKTTTQFKREHL